MKNFIFTLSLLYLSIAYSQQHFIGIKGGNNWANVASKDYFKNSKTKTGFSSGVSYEYQFKNKMSFGLDLLYSEKGFIYVREAYYDYSKAPIAGWLPEEPVYEYFSHKDFHFKFDYFSLPFKIGYALSDKFFGFANIGFCPSLLIYATTDSPFYNPDDSNESLDFISKYDFAGLVDVGGGYVLGKRIHFFAALTYQHSFTRLTGDYRMVEEGGYLMPDIHVERKVYNYSTTLSLGLKYNLTKEKE